MIDRQACANNFFHVKLTGFLGDMLALFSDFDETATQFDQGVEDALGDTDLIQPEQVEDDTKRDEYLRRYQGIIISTENLGVRTTIEGDSGEETSFQAQKPSFKNTFLRLSALNSQNLFQIRNSKFDFLRRLEQPRSMDSYQVFCEFFELPSGASGDRDYEQLLGGFKTLFPKYVWNNDQL